MNIKQRYYKYKCKRALRKLDKHVEYMLQWKDRYPHLLGTLEEEHARQHQNEKYRQLVIRFQYYVDKLA